MNVHVYTIHQNEKIASAYLMLVEALNEELLAGRTNVEALVNAIKTVKAVDVGAALVDGLSKQERNDVAANRKIEAIKNVRTRTGMALKEAKDLVEAYMGKNGYVDQYSAGLPAYPTYTQP